MVMKAELEELARRGFSQADAARTLRVSPQRISYVAKRDCILFSRHPRPCSYVEIVCPRCRATRRLRRGTGRRQKTDYCVRCHMVALGTYKLGAAASPRTKLRKFSLRELDR
jgi:hypothetical protein